MTAGIATWALAAGLSRFRMVKTGMLRKGTADLPPRLGLHQVKLTDPRLTSSLGPLAP